MKLRVGMGFDVHQLEEGRDFWLGGIKLPSTKGAVGHSDADVLIHAICDALLGAANLRDIGFHYSNKDPRWSGMDSKFFLKDVTRMLEEKGWKIGNVDCTICLEHPKINPHIDEMKSVLAPLMNISVEDVSIKATTNEKLGYVGREEGVNASGGGPDIKIIIPLADLKIIATGDGSHTLVHQQLDETYHSRHGAIQESIHVFIQNGLQFWVNQKGQKEISILEVGFGTGLNALLALHYSLTHHIKIHFTTLEAFPVAKELTEMLNYSDQLGFESASTFFQALHAAPWNKPVSISPDFAIEKREGKLQEMELPSARYDVVFFDAFAPNKQPEMWELSSLQKVTDTMKQSSVFVTYCAKGQLKRDLKALNLAVESLPGPPGKRDGTRHPMIEKRNSFLSFVTLNYHCD